MSNFLGVISDAKPNSQIKPNISFADLDYLTELLMADTLALEEDFRRKSEDVNEQEMRLHANVVQIHALDNEIKYLKAQDNGLEKYLCLIFNDIEKLEQEVNEMGKQSSNFICKCLPKQSTSYLGTLLSVSTAVEEIRKSVENSSSEASFFNQNNSAFVRFLVLCFCMF